jgi:hypothetical protein
VVTYEKGSRVIHDTAPLSEEELVQRMKEFVLESTENLAINEVTAEQEYNHMMLGQEYLREEREYEQWDCETILTTYSTLDNHPSVIQVSLLILCCILVTPSDIYYRRKENIKKEAVMQGVFKAQVALRANFIHVGLSKLRPNNSTLL